MVETKAQCIDDFGDAVARCRYTGVLLWPDDVVLIGGLVPGVRARYAIAKSEEAQAAHKACGVAFHESELNCNTCRHLERVQAKKNVGFQYGRCRSKEGKPETSPYAQQMKDGVMMFHPDDPMHMECYESRWHKEVDVKGSDG